MPDRSAENIKALVNGFFSGMLTFDLELQWTLKPGAFNYDFKWLTGRTENTELIAIAKRQFHHNYGVDLEKCQLIDDMIV